MITTAGLTQRVLIGPHDPPVHPNRGPLSRGGRVVVLDLDLHAPEPLPVPPLQHEFRRRRRLCDGLGTSWSQQRGSVRSGCLSTVCMDCVRIISKIAAPQRQRVLIHLLYVNVQSCTTQILPLSPREFTENGPSSRVFKLTKMQIYDRDSTKR